MMGKERMFICHGHHAIMRRQAHVPKGWKLARVRRPSGHESIEWFCPTCLPEARRAWEVSKEP